MCSRSARSHRLPPAEWQGGPRKDKQLHLDGPGTHSWGVSGASQPPASSSAGQVSSPASFQASAPACSPAHLHPPLGPNAALSISRPPANRQLLLLQNPGERIWPTAAPAPSTQLSLLGPPHWCQAVALAGGSGPGQHMTVLSNAGRSYCFT